MKNNNIDKNNNDNKDNNNNNSNSSLDDIINLNQNDYTNCLNLEQPSFPS